MKRLCSVVLRVAVLVGLSGIPLQAQSSPPRVFLDKSPKIVQYQLMRLSNVRLLQVERSTDDAKYAPVYTAILTRAGMSPDEQTKAATALADLNNTSFVQEALAGIRVLDADSRQDRRTVAQLVELVLGNDGLANETDTLSKAVESEHVLSQRAGFAGLFSIGNVSLAMDLSKTASQTKAWLNAVPLLKEQEARNRLRQEVVRQLKHEDLDIRQQAIRSLKSITAQRSETYRDLAELLSDDALRSYVVETLLAVSADDRNLETSARVADTLVKLAESTPVAERTSDSFTDAMQLADQVLADLPIESARRYRERLRETTVRVVKIHTVEEEMRYDIPYFAVEAGRSVQVVLINEDIMGHNLVVTTPGSLQEVAELGLAIGPSGDKSGRQYVPDSDKVLFATNMVGTAQSERLTFTAPTEVGEYPYVCTFPRHWMRMYGVMVVVEDLDAWLQNPVVPADPLGIKREFVNNWAMSDFMDTDQAELQMGLTQASADNGKALFTEATCAQCHQANGQGGKVGPALNGVLARWKDKHSDVLQEILEPSHRIDANYAVHLIITVDGDTLSGIVSAEDKKSISLLANPESQEVTVVAKDDIEEMVKTSTSMMPKGLLDRYTREEILDLLAYLTTLATEDEALSVPPTRSNQQGLTK